MTGRFNSVKPICIEISHRTGDWGFFERSDGLVDVMDGDKYVRRDMPREDIEPLVAAWASYLEAADSALMKVLVKIGKIQETSL